METLSFLSQRYEPSRIKLLINCNSPTKLPELLPKLYKFIVNLCNFFDTTFHINTGIISAKYKYLSFLIYCNVL